MSSKDLWGLSVVALLLLGLIMVVNGLRTIHSDVLRLVASTNIERHNKLALEVGNIRRQNHELAFQLEMAGYYDCVTVVDTVKKGDRAKVNYRKGLVAANVLDPIAMDYFTSGTTAKVIAGGGRTFLYHSFLCEGALRFEVDPTAFREILPLLDLR